MPLPLDSGRTELWPSDILRLPENYDLGPGNGPVDVMVYDPRESGYGLGIMVLSGYKAGLPWHIFPKACGREGENCIDIGWLKSNWDAWFAYQWDRRMIVETP